MSAATFAATAAAAFIPEEDELLAAPLDACH